MFTLFYHFLYRINIHTNDYVIVQQDWMRGEFKRLYGALTIVVAHPETNRPTAENEHAATDRNRPCRFFYPMFPRIYKNPEICLEAARILERGGFDDFELWLTFDAGVNRYAAHVVRQFADVRSVRWLGLIPRERVEELYGEADCLLFPSRLESWGLPISEFRKFGKPMLLADLPYAHETVAGHEHVRFFDPGDANALADLMMRTAKGETDFRQALEVMIDPAYVRNWSELWRFLLNK